MKHFLLALLCTVCAFALNSCSNDETPATGGIYGAISDAETNEPVAGAQVLLSPGNIATVTGYDGNYEFQDLEAGQYKLTVSASGYTDNSRQVSVTAGDRLICDMKLQKTEQVAGMALSRTTLDFGTQYNELTLDISNTGNSGNLSWNISNITVPWLDITPKEGNIGQGKSTSIKVTVDRDLIYSDVNTSFNVEAAGGSQAVRVSVRYDDGSYNEPDLEVSVDELDFGQYLTELSFDIRNNGIKDDLIWTISNITEPWLSASPDSGSTAAGKSTSVKVIVDRSLISKDVNTVFTVNSYGVSRSVNVKVRHYTGEAPSMELSNNKLDFGATKTQLSFNILNTAQTADLNWETSDVPEWLSVNPSNGTTRAGRYTTVTVTVNRNRIDKSVSDAFYINAGGIREIVMVTADYVPAGGGGGNDDDPEEDYSSATVRSGDERIKAEIVSCRRNGTTVTFNYTLLNAGCGELVYFHIHQCQGYNTPYTTITDENYNQYKDYTYSFNGIREEGTAGHALSASFPEYVKVPGSFIVRDVDPDSKYLTITIGISAALIEEPFSDPRIYFENVPIY
ncbi:MAG TPA: carboxypeptidase-like regulatory domain-containing protein [Candidatus Coprenecus stercoravium]|uniref:Carboxypeptidase-like regulatory domain-containing protein n=1 Tax=Candidatus Coprenecus stercoravium TaxID=2840735 RepID=A0A9D2GPM1_9BACT|nr:carboxypeptidase-like regulatory domain-containing protein [Candidatus Coprenecus stercoravium]